MAVDRARPQMSIQMELPLPNQGESLDEGRSEEAMSARLVDSNSGVRDLMRLVVSDRNVQIAIRRVRKNKGNPGPDGMKTTELVSFLSAHWARLREQLLAGRYQAQALRGHSIPKSGGGTRELGIPNVIDRFIQQLLLQVLQPIFDPSFSEHSYGFRPGRSAHDAIRAAQAYANAGRRIVVDVDLSKFFDRVNHDILMDRIGKRIGDKGILRLIRMYLRAGVMRNGVIQKRNQGTPQGGPLSPLLANILLDEVDKALEQRGHAFVRYADDLNVYVRSQRAGERVMSSLRKHFHALHLVMNEEKSSVARIYVRSFLGFSFWIGRGGVHLKVAPITLKTMKDRVRALTRRSRGRSMRSVASELKTYLMGWKNYFQIANTPGVFRRLDHWIRHRLRAIQLKHWRRSKTIIREVSRRGFDDKMAWGIAAHAHRWWRTSKQSIHIVLPNQVFDEMGVPRLAT